MGDSFARCNVVAIVTLGLGLVTMVCGEGGSVCSKDSGKPSGGNEYMCVDWSVGSGTMQEAQGKHYENAQEWVIFGMGSYGGIEDDNMGKCYKFNLDTGASPIIGQVTNFGEDVRLAQFDMQMGGGGFGVWNACAGATYHTINENDPCETATEDIPVWPLFPGSDSSWGKRCGGQTTIDGCDNLPEKPTQRDFLPNNEPSLVELCRLAFSWNVRRDDSNNFNAGITSGERIQCPSALVDVTTLRRADDDNFAKTMPAGMLTSTMDCCAPAGAYTSNNPTVGTDSGRERLIPCGRDGYTRSAL
ncbi:unnamed protein product [Laminaria digitata]